MSSLRTMHVCGPTALTHSLGAGGTAESWVRCWVGQVALGDVPFPSMARARGGGGQERRRVGRKPRKVPEE